MQSEAPAEGALPPGLIQFAKHEVEKALGKAVEHDFVQFATPADLHDLAARITASLEELTCEIHGPTEAKKRKTYMNTRATALARGIRREAFIARGLLDSTLLVRDALERAQGVLHQADVTSDTIRGHHAKLRKRCAEAPDEGHVAAIWEEAMKDKALLQSYSDAAVRTGEQAWVKQGYAWCRDQCALHFLQGGLHSCVLKQLRAEHYASSSEAPSPAQLEGMRARAGAAGRADPARPLQVLDVGSCYNPLRAEEHFAMTALDLCPGHPSVYQADFLDLQVGEAGSSLVVEEVEGGNGAGKLIAHPAESFDCIVFSLVLSYLPHPMQRTRMMLKARKLLREPGLLLVIDPRSIDSGVRNSLCELHHWKTAIEALGFSQIRHQKLHSSHALAFRTTGPPPADEAALLPIPIAFDQTPTRDIVPRTRPKDDLDKATATSKAASP